MSRNTTRKIFMIINKKARTKHKSRRSVFDISFLVKSLSPGMHVEAKEIASVESGWPIPEPGPSLFS